MSFSPVAGLVQTDDGLAHGVGVDKFFYIHQSERERTACLSSSLEKRILGEKDLGSAFVRGNETDNRPSLNSRPGERVSPIICGMSKNRVGCRLYFIYETVVTYL